MAILKVFQLQLQRGPTRTVFSPPGEVTLAVEGMSLHHAVCTVHFISNLDHPENTYALRAHLCADEVVIVTIDPRTGRLNLRDTGDLAAAGRGPRFTAISEKLNENPAVLLEALVRLRLNVRPPPIRVEESLNIDYRQAQTITDLAEQKANYLGLQSFRHRNFSREGLSLACKHN